MRLRDVFRRRFPTSKAWDRVLDDVFLCACVRPLIGRGREALSLQMKATDWAVMMGNSPQVRLVPNEI
jgi:hypothetical protein